MTFRRTPHIAPSSKRPRLLPSVPSSPSAQDPDYEFGDDSSVKKTWRGVINPMQWCEIWPLHAVPPIGSKRDVRLHGPVSSAGNRGVGRKEASMDLRRFLIMDISAGATSHRSTSFNFASFRTCEISHCDGRINPVDDIRQSAVLSLACTNKHGLRIHAS